ncbi:hypothetical protein J658_3509 [Acinetobacter baumannii 573719]|nr:hypothetical protein J658_3509 [Acinetobacter baumannii 573719]
MAELQLKRSWLCTFIISWQPLPKAITTQLKLLEQFDGYSAFQTLIHCA